MRATLGGLSSGYWPERELSATAEVSQRECAASSLVANTVVLISTREPRERDRRAEHAQVVLGHSPLDTALFHAPTVPRLQLFRP